MTTEKPKAEFVLGSEVSPSQFFKSTFARKFVTNCHDYNSLDYEILTDTNTNQDNNDSRNNNFFSMNNFTNKSENEKDVTDNTVDSLKLQKPASHPNTRELEALRKLCQSLEEENQKLKSASLQNVHLQTQIDTLQWQVKQVESNRQMYRSVMLQVAHFLDRTRKSLDILHNKSKDKGGRVPRSRSVHADSSLSRGPSTSSSSSASSGTRAKSATRTSNTGFREFTRSILRKNDHPARSPQSVLKLLPDVNKTDSDIIYQEPKQTELNPDEVPPEKLSQEAFRLLRTVQSLLTMQGPDLAKIISSESGGSSPSPTSSSLLHNGSFANSTMLQQTPRAGSSNSDCVNELNGFQSDKSYCAKPSNGTTEIARNLQIFLSSTRNSYIDSTCPSLVNSKTEEENVVNGFSSVNTNGIVSNEQTDTTLSSLTSNTATKKLEKKVLSCNSKSPLGSIGNESGFCSISSFQEVGLPLPLPSIRGYHTEIGLPIVDNSRHRRWSSTPVEIQGLLKHHRASFNGSQVSAKSVSIWV